MQFTVAKPFLDLIQSKFPAMLKIAPACASVKAKSKSELLMMFDMTPQLAYALFDFCKDKNDTELQYFSFYKKKVESFVKEIVVIKVPILLSTGQLIVYQHIITVNNPIV